MIALPDTLDLCRLQLDTGFVRDAAGRMLRANEQSAVNEIALPPLVVVLRSEVANVWALRAGLPDDLLARAGDLLAGEPASGSLEASPRCRAALYDLLAPIASAQNEQGGPCFVLPLSLTVPPGTIRITAENGHVLQVSFPDVLADLAFCEPCVALLEGGDAVSVCFSARRGVGADAAGVVTLPEARGRGYAAAVTAGWAAIVQAQGKLPLYSTDWDNHASRAVARKLGAQLFASEWTLTDVPRREKNHP